MDQCRGGGRPAALNKKATSLTWGSLSLKQASPHHVLYIHSPLRHPPLEDGLDGWRGLSVEKIEDVELITEKDQNERMLMTCRKLAEILKTGWPLFYGLNAENPGLKIVWARLWLPSWAHVFPWNIELRDRKDTKDFSHSATIGADKGGRASKIGSENDERKLRDPKGVSDV